MKRRASDYIGIAEHLKLREDLTVERIAELEVRVTACRANVAACQHSVDSLSAQLACTGPRVVHYSDGSCEYDYSEVERISSMLSEAKSQLSFAESELHSTESDLESNKKELIIIQNEKAGVIVEINDMAESGQRDASKVSSGVVGDYVNAGGRIISSINNQLSALSKAAGILGSYVPGSTSVSMSSSSVKKAPVLCGVVGGVGAKSKQARQNAGRTGISLKKQVSAFSNTSLKKQNNPKKPASVPAVPSQENSDYSHLKQVEHFSDNTILKKNAVSTSGGKSSVTTAGKLKYKNDKLPPNMKLVNKNGVHVDSKENGSKEYLKNQHFSAESREKLKPFQITEKTAAFIFSDYKDGNKESVVFVPMLDRKAAVQRLRMEGRLTQTPDTSMLRKISVKKKYHIKDLKVSNSMKFVIRRKDDMIKGDRAKPDLYKLKGNVLDIQEQKNYSIEKNGMDNLKKDITNQAVKRITEFMNAVIPKDFFGKNPETNVDFISLNFNIELDGHMKKENGSRLSSADFTALKNYVTENVKQMTDKSFHGRYEINIRGISSEKLKIYEIPDIDTI